MLQPLAQGEEAVRSNEVITYHTFEFEDGELWFVRFGIDHYQKLMAVGSQSGTVYIWNLDVEDPMNIQRGAFTHQKCKSPVRHATFSRDGNVLIVVCDDASIWRWDRVRSSNE